MEIVDSFFKFLTDSSRRLSARATFVATIIIAVIFIDNHLGLSYYYNNENKLNQIKKISDVLKDTTLPKQTKQELLVIREEIMQHKSWTNQFVSFVYDLSFTDKEPQIVKKDSTNTHQPVTKVDKIVASKNYRNSFWHTITSSFLLIIIIIGLPFPALTDKKMALSKALLILIVAEAFFIFLAWLMPIIFGLIPAFANPIINYLINLSINVVVIALIYAFAKKK